MSESKTYCNICAKNVTWLKTDSGLKCYACGNFYGVRKCNVFKCNKIEGLCSLHVWSDGFFYCEEHYRFLLGSKNSEEKINHPSHYTKHASGVECVDIAEHFNFNIGNAIKYLWRAGLKGDAIEDIKKAAWYCNREVERLTKLGKVTS